MTQNLPPALGPEVARLDRLRHVQAQTTAGEPNIADQVTAMIDSGATAPEERPLWIAWTQLQADEPTAAAATLEAGVIASPDMAEMHYLRALVAESMGDIARAEEAAQRASDLQPDYLECHIMLSKIRLTAPFYTDVLKTLHAHLAPACYLEIGLMRGLTFRLAKASSKVIGVDPAPQITGKLPPHFEVYDEPSDGFFADTAEMALAGTSIDFAFIDGLHEAGQALRDFFNVERHMRPGGTIALHDVIPLDAPTATPEQATMFWSGDVWKTFMALRRFCPDLRVTTVEAPPTGLALLRGLSPTRVVTEADLAEMYDYMASLDFALIADRAQHPELLATRPYSMTTLAEFLAP